MQVDLQSHVPLVVVTVDEVIESPLIGRLDNNGIPGVSTSVGNAVFDYWSVTLL